MKLVVLPLLVLVVGGQVEGGLTADNTVTKALKAASWRHGVPYNLLRSICYVESKLNPKAINPRDFGSPSYGLCQIKHLTAKGVGFRGPVSRLYNPYVNTNLAARYLNYQYSRYGDWYLATAAYNRGHVSKVIINKQYVNKVLLKMME